jgi:hypothetical protein
VKVGADVDRVCRVDGAVAFLYVLDLALLVDDEGGAIGKLKLVIQDAVLLRDLARHVAEERKFDANFFGEGGVGGRSVNADAKDGGVFRVDLAGIYTRLVSLKFLRSTLGEGKNVERQDDVLLAAIIAERNHLSLAAAQGEIGSDVSDLEGRAGNLRKRLLLRLSSGQSEKSGEEQNQEEGQDSFCHFSSFPSFFLSLVFANRQRN